MKVWSYKALGNIMQPKCINLVCIAKCMVYDAAKKSNVEDKNLSPFCDGLYIASRQNITSLIVLLSSYLVLFGV